MAQTLSVVGQLSAIGIDYEVELVPVVSAGDTDARPLSVIGERGIFASALEQALLAGTIDAAVHSCKDLALDDTPGLTLACVPFREDPRDVLCGAAMSVDELPQGARIATGSARRSASLRTLRPDLTPVEIRGNVATRLTRTVERGDDACMLAAAGLNRLDLRASAGGFALDFDQVVPEAGQGIVVVQTRAGDDAVRWDAIDDHAIRWAMDVERSVAKALGGGCEHPVGVHVDLTDRDAQDTADVYAFIAPSPADRGVIVTARIPGGPGSDVQNATKTIVELVRRAAVVNREEAR
ncbi:MAG: hydroxymethylbilane synthase [Thermoleophilia bacterium]|nr:hydroxymethylbilane synthase [Thermoleophilia bacterium]